MPSTKSTRKPRTVKRTAEEHPIMTSVLGPKLADKPWLQSNPTPNKPCDWRTYAARCEAAGKDTLLSKWEAMSVAPYREAAALRKAGK